MTTNEWQVVGFHGEVVPGRSPGAHGPIVVDPGGTMVIEGSTRDDSPVLSAEGPLPGRGARIGPWPWIEGGYVLTVDRALLREARAWAARGPHPRDEVRAFLDHVEFNRVDELRAVGAQRIPDAERVIAWYAGREVLEALRELLVGVARDRLEQSLHGGDARAIQRAAWQLQRAAMTTEDDVRAVAALQGAGMAPHEAKELLAELVNELPATQRSRRFSKALEEVRRALGKKHGQGASLDARMRVRSPLLVRNAA